MEPDQDTPEQDTPGATDGTGAVHELSGRTVAEAVARAEQGRPPADVHQPPDESAAGTAPVEQHANDPEMKQGHRTQPAEPGTERAEMPAPPQQPATSGGAQSEPGARISDLIAGGMPAPDGISTDG